MFSVLKPKSIYLQINMNTTIPILSRIHIFPSADRSWRDVSSQTIGEGKLEKNVLIIHTYLSIQDTVTRCFCFRKFKNTK